MYHAQRAIEWVAQQTDEIILFHSLTGKDSICLLEMCYPFFKRIVCVYMYTIKDLEHIQPYRDIIEIDYPSAELMEIPHYALSQYIRDGVLGCRMNPNQKVYQLNHLTEMVKVKTGIDWAIFGFKKSDGLHRRLMLTGYKDEAIKENTKNVYPLSRYKNADVLEYIRLKKLLPPLNYGSVQSGGQSVLNPMFLMFCRDYYPNDYKKIKDYFPLAESILLDYEQRYIIQNK